MESLGVGTTSPPLPSLLRDQTQPGLFFREKEEAGNKVWSPWASGQLPHPSPPCCVTRLNQGYSLVKRKKQGTKFGVPWRRENFPTPPLPAHLPDYTRVILSRERRSRSKVWSPWAFGQLPHASLSLLRDLTQPGLFSREKEKAGNKVWSPWASGQLPHPSPPCCVTRFNQGYSLV